MFEVASAPVLAFSFSFALALCGCAPLAQLEADGTCGNRIVEPNEDCDTYVDASARCGTAGQANACRYLCEPGASGEGGCPEPFVCGFDAVCRTPSGRFTRSAELRANLRSASYLLADADGDGALDLGELSGHGVSFRFGTGSAVRFGGGYFPNAPASVSFDATFRGPVLTDIDQDGRLDVVVPERTGLASLRMTEDRVLEPQLHPYREAPAISATRELVAVRDRAPFIDHDLLLFQDAAEGIVVRHVFEDETQPEPLPELLAQFSSRLYPVSVANIDVDPLRGEDEVALAVEGTGEVVIYSARCAAAGPCALELRATVTSPDWISGSPIFADTDGDGNLDLLIPVNGFTSEGTAIARGDGRGAFSTAELDPRFDIPETGCVTNTLHRVAGAGDFDGDGVADYLFDDGRLAFGGAGLDAQLCLEANYLGAESWFSIGDFDGDGIDDLAVAVFSRGGVTFLRGSATRILTTSFVDAGGTPNELVAGDYDGDGLLDLGAVTESGRVMVIFGTGHGAPSEFVEMGRAPEIDSIAGARLGRGDAPGAGDLLDDIVMLTRVFGGAQSDYSFTVVAGNTDRRLRSAGINEFRGEDGAVEHPAVVRFGNFLEPDQLSLLAVTTVTEVGDAFIEQPETHVWISTSDRAHHFRQPDKYSIACPELLDLRCTTRSAADLDGDGVDELIVVQFCGPGGAVPDPAVKVVRARAAEHALDCEPLPVDPGLTRSPYGFSVIRSGEADAELLVAYTGTFEGQPPDLALLIYDRAAIAGEHGPVRHDFDLGDRVVYTFALVQADADRSLKLAIMTDSALGIWKLDEGGPRELFETSLDPITDGFGSSILVGDLDGDRLEDLLVLRGAAFTVYLQRAASE